MKIIHTSDWHIGQIFNEYERTEEHLAFFSMLAGTVCREKPDALLVSGDIFHNPLPSAQSQKMYADAILSLRKACPGMTIVITGGNHDSGSRLEVFRELWDLAGVRVTGCLSRKDGQVSWNDHIVRIPCADGHGKTAGYVVALPHIYRYNCPGTGTACEEGATEYSRQKEFYRKMLEAVGEQNKEGLPVVLMAHLAVAGCGQEDPVGGMDYVPADIFPDGYAYLALGHIHHPQTIGRRGSKCADGSFAYAKGRPVARYCGSPIPLSFDENYSHSISIVQTGDDGSVNVREETVPCTVPVLTVPENPVPFVEALHALEEFPDDRKAYIRLNVLIEDFLPRNASFLAMEAAGKKACRYCSMKVTRKAGNEAEGSGRLTAEEMKSAGPLDVARLYFRNKYGKDMEPGMEEMLAEVINDVRKNGKEE